MRFAIYSRLLKEKDKPYIEELFEALHREKIEILVHRNFYDQLQKVIHLKAAVDTFETHQDLVAAAPDLMLCLGGDGTILEAILIVRGSNIPIAGINLGRLGLLASIEKERISTAVAALKLGSHYVEKRKLLYLESNQPIFGENNFALNDFTLLKRDTSSMIIVHTYINGDFLNSYWADGIILSTPTGSTGYSLSCGGPIIFPNSENFVITPVAPHNLNVRPIVISDNSVISFEVEGRTDNFLCTLDSRYATIDASCQLAIRSADFTISLAQLHNINFLSTIRKKLAWGIDARN